MTTTISIRLPDDISFQLEQFAKRTGQSQADFVREAIVRHLEDLEDASLAAERIKNPGRRWSMEEIEQGADLVDD